MIPSRVTAALILLTVLAGTLLTSVASAPAGAADDSVSVFEDFSGGVVPPGWRAVDGDAWTVEQGRLHGASTGKPRVITFGRHLRDFRFEALVRFESVFEPTRWLALGLDVPADGRAPWQIATMRSLTTAANGIEFSRLTTRQSWQVGTTAYAPTAARTRHDVRVSVEVHGTQARWSYDGVELARTTALRRSAAGGQALVVTGASVSFDDVRVTQLSPNPLIRRPGTALTVIAHRGASDRAPENTIPAQDLARRGPVTWIENDVQPSWDGVPFVMHDSTVDRTTDGSGPIRTLTSAQLKALDAGSWFHPRYAGTRIPTLAEQLADLRARGGDLLLEIKGLHRRDEIARIVAVIREQRMSEHVMIQTFDPYALRDCWQLAPDLPLALLRERADADPAALAALLRLTSYNVEASAVLARPELVQELHRADIAVMAWTVDDPAQWRALRDVGVDAIITNRSADLSAWNIGVYQPPAPSPSPTPSRSPAPSFTPVPSLAPTVIPEPVP